MIPSDIKFEGNAAPPQWTDGADQVIEKGTNIRIKIKGIRSEVDKMYAVGTMKEVGHSLFWSLYDCSLLTSCRITSALCRSSLTTEKILLVAYIQFAKVQQGVANPILKNHQRVGELNFRRRLIGSGAHQQSMKPAPTPRQMLEMKLYIRDKRFLTSLRFQDA